MTIRISVDDFNFVNDSTYTGNPACTDWTIDDYDIDDDFKEGYTELREVGDTLSEVASKIIQHVLGNNDSSDPLYFKEAEVEEYLKGKIREILIHDPMPLLDWNLTPKEFKK